MGVGGELRKEGWEVRREKSLSSSLGDGGLNGSRANAAGAAHEGNEEQAREAGGNPGVGAKGRRRMWLVG